VEPLPVHLQDYDLQSVSEITGSPKELIEQLAKDIATIKPCSIHQGEGINHWFHATLHNRAAYLPLMLTGNIGKPGAGCHGWAGNYKAALFQGSKLTGPGFKGWVMEDPFELNLDPKAHGRDVHAHAYTKDEEPAYWNHGDRPLIVNTPKEGRKVFTGKSHMPSPTKAIFTTNVNLINNAKWAYGMIKNVNPNVDMIVTMDTQMTLGASTPTSSCPRTPGSSSRTWRSPPAAQNPFLQIWKGGIKPLYDSKDDLAILAGMAEALGELTGDKRFARPLPLRARGPARRLHPAPARHLHDDGGLPGGRHHGRQVRPARRRPAAVPLLPARPVLRADPRQPAVLHRHRPAAFVQR
jgi:nitrate reductase alpha subunit